MKLKDELLLQRLRQEPSHCSPAGVLPVLWFGSIDTAKAATIGINPSDQEFFEQRSKDEPSTPPKELVGDKRRFETLRSLGKNSVAELQLEQLPAIRCRMDSYFAADSNPYMKWFQPYETLLGEFGWSYKDGSAVHLDIVQDVTWPKWASVKPAKLKRELIKRDLPFLYSQIAECGLTFLYCTSRSVIDAVRTEFVGRVVESGQFASRKWAVEVGRLQGRTVCIAWTNYPYSQRTPKTDRWLELIHLMKQAASGDPVASKLI